MSETDTLPAIEVIERMASGRPLRGECSGCGCSGPAGLDDRFVILHALDCPHASEAN